MDHLTENKTTYTNADIAEFLTNMATAYEIKNKSYFRIISYQNAADTIKTYPRSIHELWQQNKELLDKVPGIGTSILEKLDYLFTHHDYHPSAQKAFKGIHPAVFTFTKIDGVGPKIAYKLTKNLEFSEDPEIALEQLIEYAQQGKIRNIERFGEKSEKLILENTLNFLGQKKRMNFKDANDIAKDIIDYLKKKFPDTEFLPLGSLRRKAESVGDIDIAARYENGSDILDYFIDYPLSVQTIARGPKKASIRIKNDIRIDLMIQPEKTWGSLLIHFTGSKQHNILLRKYALDRGLSISEYGIKDTKTGVVHTFTNEEDFYHFLDLEFIKPEERLGEDEIEKAHKWYNIK